MLCGRRKLFKRMTSNNRTKFSTALCRRAQEVFVWVDSTRSYAVLWYIVNENISYSPNCTCSDLQCHGRSQDMLTSNVNFRHICVQFRISSARDMLIFFVGLLYPSFTLYKHQYCSYFSMLFYTMRFQFLRTTLNPNKN